MGSDIRVPFDESKSVRDNSGPGKRFPGGPTCLFRGVEVPALITCSSKGSITSKILICVVFKIYFCTGYYANCTHEGYKAVPIIFT